MYQVAVRVWNQIAASEQLVNPSLREMMAMSQQELHETLEGQATALERAGHSSAVINAYQQIAPLLAEHEAISRYINRTENLSLRNALPEILNAEEAVLIASYDRMMSKDEQQTLLRMFKRLEP